MNHNLYEKENGIYKLREGIALPTGKVLLLLQDHETGIIEEQLVHNLFVTTGKNSIADRLRGATNKGEITYCALGTGTNAPAEANTTLQTEIIRKLISVRSATNNAALFEVFFNKTEANAALKEAGLFGDAATATADSGTLFARTAIDRTKTDTQTLTIAWTVTIG